MNKKLVYVGVLIPLLCTGQEQGLLPEPSMQEDEAKIENDPIKTQDQEPQKDLETIKQPDQTPDVDDSLPEDDDEDDENRVEDIDVTESPEHARGNWYEKQQTLKQAHDVYQDVRQKEASVAQFEEKFIAKKNELTNKLEEFLQALPVSRAVLYQELTQELEKFEEQLPKPSQSQLTEKERIKLTQQQETKNILNQLKNDLDTIPDLYKAVDQAMAALMQQITFSHNAEQKAFESYEKIAQVLSDQVAKQLFAEILAARENIAGAAEYIKGDFSRYFDELSEAIAKSIALVHQQLNLLKEKGLDLTRASEEKNTQADMPTQAAAAKPIAQSQAYGIYTFFSAIGSFFARIWRWIHGFFI